MNIFNSLGSNYNRQFVYNSLFSTHRYPLQLQSYLENRYQGEAILVYKGREAITLAINLLNLPKNSSVAICGFTCYAVYKAIINSGLRVEYIDVEDSDLNFNGTLLRAKLKKNPDIKVVIIQNTLGYPCNAEEIAEICQRNHIFLIEDLAHSIGTIYPNHQEAGSIGDFVVLSFSQDKMIDGISGGALVIRNRQYQQINSIELKDITTKQQIIDRLYPLFTYIIRSTYHIGIGKIVHALLKKVELLSNPMGHLYSSHLHKLPYWYQGLIYKQFQNLQSNLDHRKQIALIYAKYINSKILSKKLIHHISNSTNIRFPLFVSHRESLIKYLKSQGIYVSDIWYDAPIAPGKYLHLTDYHDQCPNSGRLSSEIVNLPTHIYISSDQAREIAGKVNQWLK